MTSILERAISIIAPHHCFSCGNERNILCVACFEMTFDEALEVCFLCNKPTVQSRVCSACRRLTDLECVWIAGPYEGVAKQLIRSYKFERVRAAYKPLATAIANTLPYLEDVTVVPIPTASVRVRQRGYDQSVLLARELAAQRGWHYAQMLYRRHSLRQVGSSRSVRLQQAQSAFEVRHAERVRGKHVLLVDDVTTSGATLLAAARQIVQAGAVRVDAAVAAKHVLE